MVVQHNMQASNASRMLNITSGNQAKSTEKLSSGYRINRAADDAAGLSISEKMRKQIRGLDQASTNAQDGVSAVQTAEGALTEVHSMLQRMNELAVQASNGTNSESDRASIQDEIDQLTTEIDRVAETTKFNETYLLKGDNGTKKIKIAAHDAGLAGTLTQNATKATFTVKALQMGDHVTIGGTEYEIGVGTGHAASGSTDAEKKLSNVQSILGYTGGTGEVITIDGKSYTFDTTTDVSQSKISLAKLSAFANEGSTVSYNGKTVTMFSKQDDTAKTGIEGGVDRTNRILITAEKAYTMMANELKAASSIGADTPVTIEAANIKVNDTQVTSGNGTSSNVNDLRDGEGNAGKNVTFTFDKKDVEVANELSFNLHVGSDADMTNKIGVTIENMNSASLGIKGLNVSDATGKAATYAIDAIADAVAKVSAQRSSLGAVQNRLEHTIANVDNVVENTTAAESRIRDTDMADEMVNYSKNNILQQAGQSMLAQANQSTQGVLSILG